MRCGYDLNITHTLWIFRMVCNFHICLSFVTRICRILFMILFMCLRYAVWSLLPSWGTRGSENLNSNSSTREPSSTSKILFYLFFCCNWDSNHGFSPSIEFKLAIYLPSRWVRSIAAIRPLHSAPLCLFMDPLKLMFKPIITHI